MKNNKKFDLKIYKLNLRFFLGFLKYLIDLGFKMDLDSLVTSWREPSMLPYIMFGLFTDVTRTAVVCSVVCFFRISASYWRSHRRFQFFPSCTRLMQFVSWGTSFRVARGRWLDAVCESRDERWWDGMARKGVIHNPRDRWRAKHIMEIDEMFPSNCSTKGWGLTDKN